MKKNPTLSCSLEIEITKKTTVIFNEILNHIRKEQKKFNKNIFIERNKTKIILKYKNDNIRDLERLAKISTTLFCKLIFFIKNKFKINIRGAAIKISVKIGKNRNTPATFISNNIFKKLNKIKAELDIDIKNINIKHKKISPIEEYAYINIFTYNLDELKPYNIIKFKKLFSKNNISNDFEIKKIIDSSYLSVKIQPIKENNSLSCQIRSLIPFSAYSFNSLNRIANGTRFVYRVVAVCYANTNQTESIKIRRQDVKILALSGGEFDFDYYS